MKTIRNQGLTFGVWPLNAKFLLWPDHYSMQMPSVGQCFPFQTKWMYIS